MSVLMAQGDVDLSGKIFFSYIPVFTLPMIFPGMLFYLFFREHFGVQTMSDFLPDMKGDFNVHSFVASSLFSVASGKEEKLPLCFIYL